jgi:transposase-like protein
LRFLDLLNYKQSVWNTVVEVLQVAGYPVEDLAKEFGVNNNSKKSKGRKKFRNGHENA